MAMGQIGLKYLIWYSPSNLSAQVRDAGFCASLTPSYKVESDRFNLATEAIFWFRNGSRSEGSVGAMGLR